MSPGQLLPFFLVSVLCILAPGPDNISVVSYGISQGRRAGMLFGAGCATGCLLHTFWAFIGLSAIVAASVTAFTAIKIAGALYLFYLAFQALRSRGLAELKEAEASAPLKAGSVYFRRGFLANALNPKVALFFLAFLPQFTQPGGISAPAQFLTLGFCFAALTLMIFLAIGAFSGAVGEFLRGHSRLGVWLDRFAGTAFVLLGIRLLFAQARRNG